MKKIVLITTLMFYSIAMGATESRLATKRPVWQNVGWCSTGDANVLDANGLGSDAVWSYINNHYKDGAASISAISKPLVVTCQESDSSVRIRLRGSTVTTTGAGELWLVTGPDDAEFVADINVSLDTSPMVATMGGYYLDNVTDTNTTDTATNLRKFNYGNIHKMGVIQFDVRTASYVVIVWKQIENGIIYWDYCGY